MLKTTKLFGMFFLAAVIGFAMIACGGDPWHETVPVSGITLSSQGISIEVGGGNSYRECVSR